MTFMKPMVLILGALALSACANNPFPGFGKDGAGADGANGIPTVGGEVIEESSIAFFNTTVGDRVLFLVDQTNLTPEAIAILDKQADWLLTNTQYTALIEGHADEQGTREYNLGLGARRASTVQNYLVSRGVAGNRLETVTYGKERPLEICSDETCWSKNRRAVTVVAGGIGS